MTPQPVLRERKSSFIRKMYPKPPKNVCPNMWVLAHANGCMFEPRCSYCYLKSTFGAQHGGYEAYTNLDEMEAEMRRWIARDDLDIHMLNAGTLCDPFTFEETRPAAARMVEVFRQFAQGRPHTLLFVTKGGRQECASLYAIEPCANVIVSFSVNHPDAAARLEKGAATVEERLLAAADLKALGWRLRMRIDPMILHYDYTEVAKRVKALAPERVTLGSLRADPDLRRYVNDGLFDELEPVYEYQVSAHYPFDARVALYRQAVDAIGDQCPIALCEEPKPVWEALGLDFEHKPCNCNV